MMADSRTPADSAHGPSQTRRSVLQFFFTVFLPPIVVFLPPIVALVALMLFLRPADWWPTFSLAVIVSSWLGGKTSGLVATFFSTVLAWYFIIPSRFAYGSMSLAPRATMCTNVRRRP